MSSSIGLTLIAAAAMVLQLLSAFWVLSLRKVARGGVVGRSWNILTALVLLFLACSPVIMFLHVFDMSNLRLFTTTLFLFGSMYVAITVRLIYGVIKALTS
jgi:hypothetical protein